MRWVTATLCASGVSTVDTLLDWLLSNAHRRFAQTAPSRLVGLVKQIGEDHVLRRLSGSAHFTGGHFSELRPSWRYRANILKKI
jgi:hypothetical protein